MEPVTVVADAGPILHLYWVGATAWALPAGPILVATSVASEVRSHEPAALDDPRLLVVPDPPLAPELGAWRLDAGETAAQSLALAETPPARVRLLCDELQARRVAEVLGIEVMGSIGLVLRAAAAGRVDRETARAALEAFPTTGRFHIRPALLEAALQALRQQE